MKITFWGVRGSIASPGEETAIFGGNTSSVELQCGDRILLFDAGTGLRALGNHMLTRDRAVDATLLLSHYHWDHIQGLPFFVPLYVPTTKIHIVGADNGIMSVRDALSHQMSTPVFPVRLDEIAASITTKEVRANEMFHVGDAIVRTARGNHPGGVLAYRVDYAGKSVVYATDNEHYACVDPGMRALCEGADVLIYDAQYTPEEYAKKVGWGHSTYVAAAELAAAAHVGQLVLFHHDPSRTDAGVFEIERKTRALFANTVAAREGLVLTPQKSAKNAA